MQKSESMLSWKTLLKDCSSSEHKEVLLLAAGRGRLETSEGICEELSGGLCHLSRQRRDFLKGDSLRLWLRKIYRLWFLILKV